MATTESGLRVALIAAGVSVAVALIGGVFTYNAATTEVRGEAERSHAEFLRGQRQTLYAEFIVQAQEFEDAVTGASAASAQGNRLPDCPTRLALAEQHGRLRHSVASIQVVGSSAAREAASDVLDAFARSEAAEVCPSDAGAELVGLFYPDHEEVGDGLARFTAAARADLLQA